MSLAPPPVRAGVAVAARGLRKEYGHAAARVVALDDVDALGRTVVMVTHDPVAAGYADRVVFLVDGRPVRELASPTAERVRDTLAGLARTAGGPSPARTAGGPGAVPA